MHPKKLKHVIFSPENFIMSLYSSIKLVIYNIPLRKLFDDSIPTNYNPRISNITLLLPYQVDLEILGKMFNRNPFFSLNYWLVFDDFAKESSPALKFIAVWLM